MDSRESARIRNELEKKIFAAYSLSEEFKKVEEEYKIQKNDIASEISDLAHQLEQDNFDFEYEPSSNAKRRFGLKQNEAFLMSCKRVKPVSIKYDEEAMLRSLKKDEINALFDKSYEIIDMTGLIQLLKSYGVSLKQFKKFISVKQTLSNEKLNHLYEIGVLTLDDLKGCYTVVKKSEYWKISAKKNE